MTLSASRSPVCYQRRKIHTAPQRLFTRNHQRRKMPHPVVLPITTITKAILVSKIYCGCSTISMTTIYNIRTGSKGTATTKTVRQRRLDTPEDMCKIVYKIPGWFAPTKTLAVFWTPNCLMLLVLPSTPTSTQKDKFLQGQKKKKKKKISFIV